MDYNRLWFPVPPGTVTSRVPIGGFWGRFWHPYASYPVRQWPKPYLQRGPYSVTTSLHMPRC